MTYFEVLNASDTTDMQTLMGAANRLSGYIFMPIMLLVIFSVWVLGAVFMGKPIYRAFLFGSFICSVISILMVIMGFLSVNYMYFTFFMVAVSVIWTVLTEAPS
jgi:hypothetical protein